MMDPDNPHWFPDADSLPNYAADMLAELAALREENAQLRERLARISCAYRTAPAGAWVKAVGEAIGDTEGAPV